MKSTRKNITTNYVLESYRTDAISNRENRFTNLLISALFFVITVLLFSNSVSAQSVGLNNPNPHAKSLLDLTANDKGLLTPRMTEANRLAMFIAPDATAKGMLVFQTDNVQGFYVYDGTTWIFNGNEKTNWNTTGNKATSQTSNFIGTTDSVGLKFKTNNIDAINISANQKVTIGLAVPWSTLYVRGSDSAASAFTVRNLSYSGISGMTSISSGGTIVSQVGFVNATAPFHAGNFTVGTLANIPFTLITNNIERARLDANGNFGLDTIAPQARMHVKSNSASNWPQILVEERDSSDYSRISFMNKGTNKFWTTAAHNEQVDSLSFYNIYNSSTANLLTVRGDGNLGLGYSAPMYPLTFKSTLGDKISLWGGYGGHYGMGIQAYLFQIYAGGSSDDIAFGYGSSNAFTENMRIKGSGNVGIGIINPSQKLDVAGNINMINDTNNIRIAGLRVFSVKGVSNLFAGEYAGLINTGTANTFLGDSSGYNNTSGYSNTAVGMNTLKSNTTGMWNTAVGRGVLEQNTTGYSNTAMGIGTLITNTTGYRNTAIGGGDLQNNTTGFENTALGYYASRDNKTANFNVAVGTWALLLDSTGNGNAALGHSAGYNTTSGNNNVFVGRIAGSLNTTGNNNIALGYNAQVSSALTNTIAIGTNATATTSNTMILGGTGADAVNVGIGTNAPQHKLSFGNDLGSKISFWQGGTTNYGIGVQGYLLQYYTAANSDDHVFGYGSSAAFTENMRIKGNGDVGIGTATPTATLEVNGFTKLGTDAPAVKIKKYTGNTAATANGNINFAHGLNQAKILSVEVLVSSTSNTLYPPENSSSSGAYYHYFVTTTAVYIANDASNSANMLNRPYRVLITYEE